TIGEFDARDSVQNSRGVRQAGTREVAGGIVLTFGIASPGREAQWSFQHVPQAAGRAAIPGTVVEKRDPPRCWWRIEPEAACPRGHDCQTRPAGSRGAGRRDTADRWAAGVEPTMDDHNPQSD